MVPLCLRCPRALEWPVIPVPEGVFPALQVQEHSQFGVFVCVCVIEIRLEWMWAGLLCVQLMGFYQHVKLNWEHRKHFNPKYQIIFNNHWALRRCSSTLLLRKQYITYYWITGLPSHAFATRATQFSLFKRSHVMLLLSHAENPINNNLHFIYYTSCWYIKQWSVETLLYMVTW